MVAIINTWLTLWEVMMFCWPLIIGIICCPHAHGVFILNKAFHMLFGLSYTRQQHIESQKTDIVENSIQGEDIQNLWCLETMMQTYVHQCWWHHWQTWTQSMCDDVGVFKFVSRQNGHYIICIKKETETEIDNTRREMKILLMLCFLWTEVKLLRLIQCILCVVRTGIIYETLVRTGKFSI